VIVSVRLSITTGLRADTSVDSEGAGDSANGSLGAAGDVVLGASRGGCGVDGGGDAAGGGGGATGGAVGVGDGGTVTVGTVTGGDAAGIVIVIVVLAACLPWAPSARVSAEPQPAAASTTPAATPAMRRPPSRAERTPLL
jgi:hypothetical protein